MTKPDDTTTPAGGSPLERGVGPLVDRLRDEADLCRNEGATDIADLLDEAAEEMHNLAWALSLPGFDRMATDEQEAEHQAGVARVNELLARMEKAKAEHDAMVRDAARYRWHRDRNPGALLATAWGASRAACAIGADCDAATDAAMADAERPNAEVRRANGPAA